MNDACKHCGEPDVSHHRFVPPGCLWTVVTCPGGGNMPMGTDKFKGEDCYQCREVKAERDKLRKENEALLLAIDRAVHAAVLRALDEAGLRNDVLRGMCVEVAIEQARDVLEEHNAINADEAKA